MKSIVRTIGVICVFVGLCILGGCNTMEGVGKDLKQAGGTIEDAAKS